MNDVGFKVKSAFNMIHKSHEIVQRLENAVGITVRSRQPDISTTQMQLNSLNMYDKNIISFMRIS